jgi:hypothetical protein
MARSWRHSAARLQLDSYDSTGTPRSLLAGYSTASRRELDESSRGLGGQSRKPTPGWIRRGDASLQFPHEHRYMESSLILGRPDG